eukprot:Hpha_TRINITY_DN17842_c0_g1::TRINITY_DN17842_c0_g1_i1::g.177458::m.177458
MQDKAPEVLSTLWPPAPDALSSSLDLNRDKVLQLAWKTLGLPNDALYFRSLREPPEGWRSLTPLQVVRRLQAFTIEEADRQENALAVLKESARLARLPLTQARPFLEALSREPTTTKGKKGGHMEKRLSTDPISTPLVITEGPGGRTLSPDKERSKRASVSFAGMASDGLVADRKGKRPSIIGAVPAFAVLGASQPKDDPPWRRSRNDSVTSISSRPTNTGTSAFGDPSEMLSNVLRKYSHVEQDSDDEPGSEKGGEGQSSSASELSQSPRQSPTRAKDGADDIKIAVEDAGSVSSPSTAGSEERSGYHRSKRGRTPGSDGLTPQMSNRSEKLPALSPQANLLSNIERRLSRLTSTRSSTARRPSTSPRKDGPRGRVPRKEVIRTPSPTRPHSPPEERPLALPPGKPP